MMEEPEKDRLDQSLREKFEQFRLPPAPPIWAGVAPHITRPPQPALRKRRRPVPLPWLFGLTALLAGLGGWLLPHGATPMATKPARYATGATAEQRGPQGVQSPVTTPRSSISGPQTSIKGQQSTIIREQSSVEGPQSLSFREQSLIRGPQTSVFREQSSVKGPQTSALSKQSAIKGQQSTGFNEQSLVKGPQTSVPTPQSPVIESQSHVFTGQPVAATASITQAILDSTVTASLPATLRPLAALERQTLVQLPSVATLAPGTLPADSRTTLLVNLRQERAELFRLQRRTDSLLLALGDLPGAPLAAPAVVAAPVADTSRPQPLKHRWSVLLTATPEQNTLNLQGPETDSLTALRRNHETGRAGVSAAIMAEYQLTKRLSIGGGVGYTSFGADLRITNKTTDVNVRFDTVTTRSTSVYTSVNHTYSVRIIQVPQPSPVFNSNGQVIRYDTVYVPRRDTVYSTIVQHDTTHTTNHTITPTVTKKETTTTKLLQPTYRFFTVPVLLRYRLSLGPGRWWADVAGGAQFQLFLGGTQVVTPDGVNFRTESITAGNGPFRPLNVAVTGSLAINYALTNRLSLSVAPSMRWQALSLYKPETGLRQQPTATGLMFGVRFGL